MTNIEKNLLLKKKGVAKRIIAVLNENDWTQRDLARKTGLKDSYVSEILSSQQNLTLKTITILEEGLGQKLIEVL